MGVQIGRNNSMFANPRLTPVEGQIRWFFALSELRRYAAASRHFHTPVHKVGKSSRLLFLSLSARPSLSARILAV